MVMFVLQYNTDRDMHPMMPSFVQSSSAAGRFQLTTSGARIYRCVFSISVSGHTQFPATVNGNR